MNGVNKMKNSFISHVFSKNILLLSVGAFLSISACSKKKINDDNPVPPPSDANYTITGQITCNAGVPESFSFTSTAVEPVSAPEQNEIAIVISCLSSTPTPENLADISALGIACLNANDTIRGQYVSTIYPQNDLNASWNFESAYVSGCVTTGTFSGTFTVGDGSPLPPAIVEMQSTAYLVVQDISIGEVISITPIGVCNITSTGC